MGVLPVKLIEIVHNFSQFGKYILIQCQIIVKLPMQCVVDDFTGQEGERQMKSIGTIINLQALKNYAYGENLFFVNWIL